MSESQSHGVQADRNLLFGILALQMDFISRDQLVAALHAWVLDKEQTLGQILCARGDMAQDECDLLGPLVKKHLKKHGGNAYRSLAAIPPALSVQELLASVQDGDVQAGLLHLQPKPGEDHKAADAYSTLEQARPPDSALLTRFRILRPHARGGLGEVFVALDGELHREVALKEIQSQHADRMDSRSRFLLEAEITGGLEHPGIVPVYSLGHYSDGRPYYAMRFIKGDSLAEAIEHFHATDRTKLTAGKRQLALRALLRRFVDVCNAIAYAHSRGVLHRDLKPSNIMLGNYGETLVVDWGLAKATGTDESVTSPREQPLLPHSGSGSAPTQMGTAIGTPAFMSPEQAEGRLDALGPQSDVYSLGATLYQLLTGKAAFGGDVGAVLRNVQKGEIRPPRNICQEVPRPLEAVCLRAMALRPENRYATPLALASDVEHWLADEPVTAYREPLAARASRWMRRHRTTMAAAASLLLAAVVGSTVGIVLIGQKNVEIETKRQEALTERDRAEGNFKLARQAVEKTLSGVAKNERLKETNFHDLRMELLQAAAQFYEEFVKQKSHDPALEAERGRAYYRLARLRSEMDEPKAAQAELETMHSIFAKLVEQHPEEPSYREELAASLYGLGVSLNAQGAWREAEERCRQGLAIQKALAEEYPGTDSYREQLALSQLSLGQLLNSQGKAKEAEESFRTALAMQKALIERDPKEPYFRQQMALTLTSLGDLLLAQNKPIEAEETHRAALAIEMTLTGDYPKVLVYRMGAAMSQTSLARSLNAQRKTGDAETAFRSALAMLQALNGEYPKVPAYRKELAGIEVNLGELFRARGNVAEAEKAFNVASNVYKGLAQESPSVPLYRVELARTLNALGSIQKDSAKPSAAEESFQAALALQKKLAEENPKILDYQEELAASECTLGFRLHLQGKLETASESYRTALAIQKTLVEQNPKVPAYRDQLATSLFALGALLNDQAKPQEAEEFYREALTIQKSLLEENAQASAYRAGLARTHYSLGLLLSDNGRLLEAVTEFRQAGQLGQADAAGLIQQCERQLALVNRLPAILKGQDKPKDAAEEIEFALLCQRPWQERNRAAVRFYEAAFAGDGKLADDMQQQHRYNASCAAALASAGKGKDGDTIDAADTIRLRKQALAWLTADLAYWTKQAASGNSTDRNLAHSTLLHWQQDSDLASVRGANITKLPPPEQAAWQRLWQGVETVLAKIKMP